MVAASKLAVGRFPRVLVTGFEPFGGDAVNPSREVAQALHGREIAGHRVIGALLPVAFGRSLASLHALLALHRPALVLCCGQAGGRGGISLERVAINVCDARIADNDRAQPVDEPVVPGGPAAYFTGLPVKAMLAALRREGIAAEVSQTAGTFVCNQVFYGLMHGLAGRQGRSALPEGPVSREGGSTRGGFIHVPWLPGQGQPSMPLEEMVRALHVAMDCALTTDRDIRLQAGTLN